MFLKIFRQLLILLNQPHTFVRSRIWIENSNTKRIIVLTGIWNENYDKNS